MADDDVQLAGLKLGQKVGDGTTFQTEVDRGIKLLEVICNFVVEHGGIPCFGAAQSHSAAELGDGSLYLSDKIIIAIQACLKKIIKGSAGGGGLQSAYLAFEKIKAQFLLHLGYALADGGLRNKKSCRGFCEAAFLDNLQEAVYLSVCHYLSPEFD